MDMEKESENKIKTQEWRKNTFFVIVPTTHYQEIFFLNNQQPRDRASKKVQSLELCGEKARRPMNRKAPS